MLNITHWRGGSGDWGSANHWSNGAPGAGSDAEIDAAGAYGVTIAQGSAYSVGAVGLRDAGATLALQGTLSNAGAFDLAAGTLALNVYGVLSGGTLKFDGGALASQGGTFDGVSVVGPMALTGDFQTLNIIHGLKVTDTGGGAGQIVLTGEFDTLNFAGSQTFDNAIITLSNDGSSTFGGVITCTGALTLGSHCTVTTAGLEAEETLGGATIVNQGSIISAAGSFFGITIEPGVFINQGVIEADNLTWEKGRSFTNGASGQVAIATGQVFIVDHSFHNQGTITIGSGGRLRLNGQYTLADLGNIQNGGEIELNGALQNQGQVLTLGQGPLAGSVSITGTITGGVVRPGGAVSQVYGATLDAVTWQGALNLTAQYSGVTVVDGLTLTGASGTGPGVANITGGGVLLFEGTQTFDTATVTLGAGSGNFVTLVDLPRSPDHTDAGRRRGDRQPAIGQFRRHRRDAGQRQQHPDQQWPDRGPRRILDVRDLRGRGVQRRDHSGRQRRQSDRLRRHRGQ